MTENRKCGIRTFEYECCDSTNERAKIYAKDGWDGEPTLFLAEEQTSGRGRYSRKFYSKSGAGVYLSLLFKPNSGISDTTPIIAHTANSMIHAIEALAPVTVNIKWVNDLILGGRKLGGILIEGQVSPESKTYDYLIVGIGVNLYSCEMDEEIKSIATSLEAECGRKVDKGELISLFMSHFLGSLDSVEGGDCEAPTQHREQGCYKEGGDCFSLYKSRLITLEKAVTVKTLTEEYSARVIDLLPDYSLLVMTEDGEEKRIFTGEVKITTKKHNTSSTAKAVPLPPLGKANTGEVSVKQIRNEKLEIRN